MIACGLVLYLQVLFVGVGQPHLALAAALLLLGWWCCLVVAIDLRELRLPDARTGPLVLGAAALLLVPSSIDEAGAPGQGHPGRLVLAVAGGIGLALVYLVLHLLGRGALGFGDVKFAVPLGIVAAWFGPATWMTAAVLPFLIASGFGLILVLGRRMPWSTRIPFGPCMLAGVVAAVVLDAVGR